MLPIITFKWKKPIPEPDPVLQNAPLAHGFKFANHTHYGARHVNVLRNMLERHLHIDHRLICITDDPTDIDPRIECFPLWSDLSLLGGCYRRLKLFDGPFAKSNFGDRFAVMDLDCVLVRDVTPIFTRTEDFIIKAYQSANPGDTHQRYNGSLYLMNAGCRQEVWTELNSTDSNAFDAHITCSQRGNSFKTNLIGTDQSFIQVVLGSHEATFTAADGIHEARNTRWQKVNDTARAMFFSGAIDPSDPHYRVNKRWIIENWK